MKMGGVSEVAQILGVSRQRVSKLRERPDFPDPLGELAQGPIWDLEAIERWHGSGLRQASAGRPRSQVAATTLGGRFILEEQIGHGGFADVYRAIDKKQAGRGPTLVAVKVLNDVASLDPEAIRRFKRELRLLEQLEHPNIVPVLGHGETSVEGIWYAMPLAQGSAADAVDELTKHPAAILDLMRQVCAGLAYVHGTGIFHRDLKPGNILRTGSGSWAISDFGLAVEAERNTTVLTSTMRAGLGSWWYTAPEQWKNARSADHQSDIYSLGKILQELVTGEAPINNEMQAGPFRPIVERATANRPDQRYATVEEFLSAVALAVEGPGQWETAEDVAKRLLERVRLPEPASEDLDELLSWAQSLDEREHEDMLALSRVLPWISAWSIDCLWARDRGAFRRIFQHYSDRVAEGSFQFDYCDVLADFSRRAVEETGDSSVLRATAMSLAQLGEHHNRWHVRDVLTGVLQTVRDTEMALAALEGLRAAPKPAVDWTITDFTLRSLHPVLRTGIQEVLEKNPAS